MFYYRLQVNNPIRNAMYPIYIRTKTEVEETQAVFIAKKVCHFLTEEDKNHIQNKICLVNEEEYKASVPNPLSVNLQLTDEWLAKLPDIANQSSQEIAQTAATYIQTLLMEPFYDITRCLTISTAHISEQTETLLEEESETNYIGISVYTNTYGYRIWISDDAEDYFKEKTNMPNDLWNCIRLASKLGCQWLCLDGDGEEVKELPKFD